MSAAGSSDERSGAETGAEMRLRWARRHVVRSHKTSSVNQCGGSLFETRLMCALNGPVEPAYPIGASPARQITEFISE